MKISTEVNNKLEMKLFFKSVYCLIVIFELAKENNSTLTVRSCFQKLNMYES